jgi:hypothetical protein
VNCFDSSGRYSRLALFEGSNTQLLKTFDVKVTNYAVMRMSSRLTYLLYVELYSIQIKLVEILRSNSSVSVSQGTDLPDYEPDMQIDTLTPIGPQLLLVLFKTQISIINLYRMCDFTEYLNYTTF